MLESGDDVDSPPDHTDAGPPVLRVEELRKRFGQVQAVDSVTFTVGSGQIVGLLGPNGAGKTTIINVLSTLVAPDSGSATVAGHDLADDPAGVRRSIALTGQFAAVDEVLTGAENLVLFARLRGLARAAARARAGELLERFSLADAADNAVSTYSGGMRRRLDLAASLVVPTPVLFLDEPTTGLDPRSRTDLWAEVRRLKGDGMSMVLTTQYLEEADQLADRVIVIDHGRVVAEGTPSELKAGAGTQVCVLNLVDLTQLDRAVEALAGLGEVAVDPDLGTVTVPDASPAHLADAMARLEQAGIGLEDVSLRRPSLDEVFLQLTEAGR